MISYPSVDPRDWVWTSRDIEPASALSEWSDLVSAEIAEMAIESDQADRFGAAWTRYGLGPLDLNFLSCSPQRVARSAEMIGRDQEPFYELLFVRRGRVKVSQKDAFCDAGVGRFILLDDQSPYSLDFPEDAECLTVRMPDEWLRPWLTRPQALVGQVLGSDEGWSRPLAGLLTTIAEVGLSKAALPRPVIADQIGALCALLAGTVAEPCGKHRLDLATRISARIAARHREPALSPTDVADDLGISRRHLHRVLAASGGSYSQTLFDIRVHRASQLLDDPRHRRTAIGELAWQVGFADQSHFARAFKARTGMSPSQFRNRSRLS